MNKEECILHSKIKGYKILIQIKKWTFFISSQITGAAGTWVTCQLVAMET